MTEVREDPIKTYNQGCLSPSSSIIASSKRAVSPMMILSSSICVQYKLPRIEFQIQKWTPYYKWVVPEGPSSNITPSLIVSNVHNNPIRSDGVGKYLTIPVSSHVLRLPVSSFPSLHACFPEFGSALMLHLQIRKPLLLLIQSLIFSGFVQSKLCNSLFIKFIGFSCPI